MHGFKREKNGANFFFLSFDALSSKISPNITIVTLAVADKIHLISF